MTDLVARRIETEHTDQFTSLYKDKFLRLSGNSPVTILVNLVETPTGVVPGFALAGDGMVYIKGIHWNYPEDALDYSLFITFQLAPKVLEVSCDTLWYSVVQSAVQQMCVRTGHATYHFDVEISEDVSGVITVDPKIVVTPIVEMTDCDDDGGDHDA